ncbi:MAG: prephenate dehydratase [Magnetococcales bacterium]|nr:prephenate dehydratase [Magnetococcales bacterium]
MASSNSEPPATADTLDDCRKAIDRIDDTIHDLLMERAGWVLKVGELKGKSGSDVAFYRPEREARIHRRLEARHNGSLPIIALHRIYREIISASLNLEKELTVAYLGPKATFTHQAALKQFGSSFKMFPVRTINEVFHEVEIKRADFGVAPVENSIEGIVNHTLDRLVDSSLLICGEVYLPIVHVLLSGEVDLKKVDVVYSHHLAVSQCRTWLARYLPGVRVEEVRSTAQAAKLAKKERKAAAIAGIYAADEFGLNILAEHIEDRADNENRFLVIGHHTPSRSGQDMTSIMFSFRDEPGFLHRVLGIFSSHNINLTRIESRPSRKKAWDYLFFIDFEGHQEDANASAALEELSAIPGVTVKLLGSYPRRVL